MADKLLRGSQFQHERNDWDWLGHGVYFWESNPSRGLEYAHEVAAKPFKNRRTITEPTVVGAVIDLGYCLDLVSSNGILAVAAAYKSFRKTANLAGKPMPRNDGGADRLRRALDCAVINHLHEAKERDQQKSFDTVRGVFLEDRPIYPTAGFRKKTHVQVCVRNPSQIKGVFRVPKWQME